MRKKVSCTILTISLSCHRLIPNRLKKTTIKSLTQIYKHFRDYRGRIASVFSLTALYSFLEGFGIASFIPVFYLIAEPSQASGSRIAIMVNDLFHQLQLPLTLNSLLIFILLIFLGKLIFHYLSNMAETKLISDYERNIKNRLFGKLFQTRWQYFMDRSRGHLYDELITQTQRTKGVLSKSLVILNYLTNAVVYLCIAFLISVPTTAISIALILLLGYLLFPFIKKSKQEGEELVSSQKEFSNLITQFISGFNEIKTFNVFSEVSETISSETDRLRNSRVSLKRLRILTKILVEGITISAVILFIYIGLTYIKGVGLAEIGVIALLFNRIFRKAASITEFQSVAQSLPSLETVSNTLKEFEKHSESREDSENKINFQTSIRFQSVSFTYDKEESEKSAGLDNVSFEVNRGEMVGICGESGAGKTTLIHLLLGFLPYRSGKILIDDVPLGSINLKFWRSQIGYVPQNSFLLNGTIEENIRFYRRIPEKRIRESARLANATPFITDTREGYQTVVGENGIKLSGGQRQRIVLARALAGNPDILLLDEATSELDSHAEKKIQNALEELRGELTIISIAHQLSTILSADRIIVLQDGVLKESGTKQELLNMEGLFKKMYQLQVGSDLKTDPSRIE